MNTEHSISSKEKTNKEVVNKCNKNQKHNKQDIVDDLNGSIM